MFKHEKWLFEDHILVFWLTLKLNSRKIVRLGSMVEDYSELLTPNKE